MMIRTSLAPSIVVDDWDQYFYEQGNAGKHWFEGREEVWEALDGENSDTFSAEWVKDPRQDRPKRAPVQEDEFRPGFFGSCFGLVFVGFYFLLLFKILLFVIALVF